MHKIVWESDAIFISVVIPLFYLITRNRCVMESNKWIIRLTTLFVYFIITSLLNILRILPLWFFLLFLVQLENIVINLLKCCEEYRRYILLWSVVYEDGENYICRVATFHKILNCSCQQFYYEVVPSCPLSNFENRIHDFLVIQSDLS